MIIMKPNKSKIIKATSMNHHTSIVFIGETNNNSFANSFVL